jgi:hypothetical protein
MNTGVALLLGGVTVVLTVIAVAAGTNEAIALPAAGGAVAAAAGLLVGIAEKTRWPAVRTIPLLPADPARVRTSLGAGLVGRPGLIALLDRLERAGGDTTVGVTSADEVKRLRSLSDSQFRAYLDARLRDLEGRT